MKRLIIALCLIASPLAAQDVNHTQEVARAKSDLVQRGISLDGPCGAFQITKRVAWTLRGEQAGLLSKTTGNNCEGYSTDIVAFPSGRIVDVLGDSGGANNPSWGCCDQVDASRYRPAFDPGDSVVNPPAPQPPTSGIEQMLNDLREQGNELVDVTKALQGELLALQVEVKAVRTDIADFRAAVKSKWETVSKAVVKYVLPLVGGLLLGHQVAK